tara:strand:- start:831 stop:1472 length:642 start_codon:yes stop_codon:yes gene_type:complete
MSQYINIPRYLNYLEKRRIVYRQDPISDQPTLSTPFYDYYKDGTYECYHLFRSKAKITTYKSLKWHLLVLWYLNPQLDQNDFLDLSIVIADYKYGFIAFDIPHDLLKRMVYDVSMLDLDEPPKNKSRKIIFKQSCGLSLGEKLKIVGQLIGRSSRIDEEVIYQGMCDIHDVGKKITMKGLATSLQCSVRTIHRNMTYELKKEKELLNKTNEKI